MFNFLLSGVVEENTVDSVDKLVQAFRKLMTNILGPVLIIIGLLAVCYAIYLGVLYAKAEDANKRKEVQGRLIGACIGVVIIIVGVSLCYALNWEKIFTGFVKGSASNSGLPAQKAFISGLFR